MSIKLEATAQDGIVTLSGTVGSWQEFRAAQKNPFEGGAVSIINDLKLE
jgi:hypothetical protein